MYKIGEIFYADSDIEINKGLETCTLTVTNLGDRPIQVGSHFHFFETNKFFHFYFNTVMYKSQQESLLKINDSHYYLFEFYNTLLYNKLKSLLWENDYGNTKVL